MGELEAVELRALRQIEALQGIRPLFHAVWQAHTTLSLEELGDVLYGEYWRQQAGP